MTSHFLAQDLKHINSELTYQCDVTQKTDFLIIHPFSLMVNQTSEFQVLGSGSTFKRSFVSIFTSAHPRTLLEPAEPSSRPRVLLLSQSCHIDFLLLAKSGLWRRVAGCLVRDVPKDRCGPWMTYDPSKRRKTIPQRHGVVSQNIRIISNNDTRISYLPTPRFFSPCRRSRVYLAKSTNYAASA